MTKNNRKGFTIIEVVLVLAIAGLIFLMVFIALPALQRSQRNTRRRQDMARILSAVTDYQSNNGTLPWVYNGGWTKKDTDGFVIKYVIGDSNYKNSSNEYVYNGSCSDQFCDPDGTSYSMDAYSDPDTFNKHGNIAKNKTHEISAVISSKCSGNESSPTEAASGAGQVSLVYLLEGGAVYCGDNQ